MRLAALDAAALAALSLDVNLEAWCLYEESSLADGLGFVVRPGLALGYAEQLPIPVAAIATLNACPPVFQQQYRLTGETETLAVDSPVAPLTTTVLATGGVAGITLTMPAYDAVTSAVGRRVTIARQDAGAGAVNIVGNGAEVVGTGTAAIAGGGPGLNFGVELVRTSATAWAVIGL